MSQFVENIALELDYLCLGRNDAYVDAYYQIGLPIQKESPYFHFRVLSTTRTTMVIIRAMEAIWPMSKPSLESRDPYSLLGDKLNFIVDIKSLINQLKAFSSISFMRFVLLKFAVCSANEVEEQALSIRKLEHV